MKRSKDELHGNQMFPRLNINDADKGGPKAPPRNKMALYEQLSIPSQKMESTSPSSSVLPLPLNKKSHIPPSSASLTHVRMKNTRFTGSCDVSLPVKLPRPTDFAASSNIDAAKREGTYTDHQHTTKHFPSSQNFSHFKNLYRKKSVDEEGRNPLSSLPSITQNSTEESNRSFEALGSSRDAVIENIHVSPDDVVKAIGEKRFWEARKAIVNQQRVFSKQVLELHKLVKVQKMIAGCPDILLEEKLYGDTTGSPKNDSLKDAAGENEGLGNEVAGKEGNMSGWCLSPAGSHVLVPVVSQSEGFVYKTYSGGAETIPLVPMMGAVPMQMLTVRSSSVLSSQASRVRECEMHQSSESCSQALNLFPMSSDHSKRVIKVIPHNPTSASESIARIFQSIRKDRKHT